MSTGRPEVASAPEQADGPVNLWTECLDLSKPRQRALAASILASGERPRCLVDIYGWGTGVFVVSDRRVACIDVGWILRRREVTSIPLDRISAVRAIDRGRDWLAVRSTLVIDVAGDEKSFRFHGGDTAERVHDILVSLLVPQP